MPPDAPGGAALPLYGPIQVLEVAAGRGTASAPGITHALVVIALLLAVAWFGFRRRGVAGRL